jgi:DNA-directed RNA polymerase specialized sigma24 family protein
LEAGDIQDRGMPVDDQVTLQATLEAALRKLPEREQRILYAVYVGGYTTDEIAGVLGLEASWVRRLRGRALAQLRAELTDPGDVPWSPGAESDGAAKKDNEEESGHDDPDPEGEDHI